LLADAGVVALVGTGIYNGFVPASVTADPVIVIGLNAGGMESVTPQSSFDLRYTVKVISRSGNTASLGADTVRNALHQANLGTVRGWRMMRCDARAYVEFVEQEEKQQWYHAGWVFRVRGYEEE
jgi:hypothetical protein